MNRMRRKKEERKERARVKNERARGCMCEKGKKSMKEIKILIEVSESISVSAACIDGLTRSVS